MLLMMETAGGSGNVTPERQTAWNTPNIQVCVCVGVCVCVCVCVGRVIGGSQRDEAWQASWQRDGRVSVCVCHWWSSEKKKQAESVLINCWECVSVYVCVVITK